MRNRRSWKIRLGREETEARAARSYNGHAILIAEGYRLAQSSAFFATRKGTVTARLVYRSNGPRTNRVAAITVTVKGLPSEAPAR